MKSPVEIEEGGGEGSPPPARKGSEDHVHAALEDLTQPLVDHDHDHEDEDGSIQHTSKPAPPKTRSDEKPDQTKALLISFLLMVVVGLGNKVFQVLQFVPMYNYALFVNILSTFAYIPMSFAYIIPMQRAGKLNKDTLDAPKRSFVIMGILDSIAGVMQSLSVNFVANGALVQLLMQAAIPISMVMSYYLLNKRYNRSQYAGAIIVAVGLVVVLIPSFVHPAKTGSNVVVWSIVLMLSCVPMCLSSVYKETSLGDRDVDAIYMNGMIAVAQLFASVPLLLPSAPAANVHITDLPSNLWDGARCLAQINSVTEGKHADDCHWAPVYVSVYLCFNMIYNVLILFILKYGSANILWLAMTVIFPIANLAFALDFMPSHSSPNVEDVIGLILILAGLVIYRFYKTIAKRLQTWNLSTPDYRKLGVSPASPFLTSKSADAEDQVSTPGRGGFHTTHKKRKERQRRYNAQDEAHGNRKAVTPSSRTFHSIKSPAAQQQQQGNYNEV